MTETTRRARRSWLRAMAGLSATDWRLFLSAWLLLLLADLGLRLLPYPRLLARFRIPAQQDEAGGEADARPTPVQLIAAQRQKAVRRAARRHLYPMTCLRQSLVLQRLLAEAGVTSELRIGVRKDSTGLAAHAWVELAGQPLGERPDVRQEFAVLEQMPATRLREVD